MRKNDSPRSDHHPAHGVINTTASMLMLCSNSGIIETDVDMQLYAYISRRTTAVWAIARGKAPTHVERQNDWIELDLYPRTPVLLASPAL